MCLRFIHIDVFTFIAVWAPTKEMTIISIPIILLINNMIISHILPLALAGAKGVPFREEGGSRC